MEKGWKVGKSSLLHVLLTGEVGALESSALPILAGVATHKAVLPCTGNCR